MKNMKQTEHDSHQGKRPLTGIFRPIQWYRSIFHVLSAIISPVPGQVWAPMISAVPGMCSFFRVQLLVCLVHR